MIRKAGSVTASVIVLALAACTNASTSSLGETGSSLLANAPSSTRPNLNVPIVVTHINVSLPTGSAQSSMKVLVLYPRTKRHYPLSSLVTVTAATPRYTGHSWRKWLRVATWLPAPTTQRLNTLSILDKSAQSSTH